MKPIVYLQMPTERLNAETPSKSICCNMQIYNMLWYC